MRYPTIKSVSTELKYLKPFIEDEYRAEGAGFPSIDITLGWNPETGGWNLQTGDNSFMGSAYGHPAWATGFLHRRSNCREVAKDLIDQLRDYGY